MTELTDIKISILTPSIRPSGINIVDDALSKQRFRDFEWIICGPESMEESFFKNINKTKYTYIGNPSLKAGQFWDLNYSYNKMIKEANGELIISWQDFTWADEKTLDKFWYCCELEPNTLVSAVGDKYIDDTWKDKTWSDPRKRNDLGKFYPCYPSDIEWNLCSCPKEAILKVGGFDEQLDFMGFGMDAYSVNERIEALGGYDFKLNQGIESFSLGHGRVDNWEENNLIHGGYIKRKKELISNGQWPVIANNNLKS